MHELARRAIEGDEPISLLVREFYGPTGPLAERGWDVRSQQVEMSVDIALLLEAYEAQPTRSVYTGQFVARAAQWGFVEAPCGTGKGLAYGVPGIFAALRAEREFKAEVEEARKTGKPVPVEPRKLVVTTANIALQEQLVRKDFPALAEMLGITDKLRIVLMKSRANYLCRYKVRSLGGHLLGDHKITRLVKWMDAPNCDGDKESLDHDPGDVWGEVSAGIEDCLGTSCPHYAPAVGDAKPCYWRTAIVGHLTAHVVVTNHHFLAVARGLRSCLLAVDESHELEDSLRSSQSRAMTPFTGKGLANSLNKLTGDDVSGIVDMPVRWMMDLASKYLGAQAPTFGNQPPDLCKLLPGWLKEDQPRALQYVEGMQKLLGVVENACTNAGCIRQDRVMLPPRFNKSNSEASENGGKLAKAWERLLALVERYEAIVLVQPNPIWAGSDGPWAFYLEESKNRQGEARTIAKLAPADVAWATAALALRYPAAVFTTATMPAFQPQRVALGLGTSPNGAPAPRYEKRLPSPYNLAEQGVLIIPNGPKPTEPSWSEWATAQVVQAVEAAGGGTLVLASSIRQMKIYAQALRNAAGGQPWDVKMQGDAGRGELRRWFKEDEDGVLCGTKSFFQGMDIQGRACRLVIIDRIPFARPDDPVEEAVGKLLVQRAGPGHTAYLLRTIPAATMILAQGAGRLIRSKKDRGAVLLLDNRLTAPGEGWLAIRRGIPEFPLSRDLGDITRRLHSEGLQGIGQVVQARIPKR